VAIILAVGICTAVNLLTAGVLYDAVASAGPGLSDNATQVLTLVFGGIIGILGSYFGYKAGQAGNDQPPPP
jgi:sulfite exporter TauE/SafE